MIIPVRCFTCNRVLGSKYQAFQDFVKENQPDHSKIENILKGDPDGKLLDEETVYQKGFKKIGINDRYCCKRHIISHIDLIEKI